MIEKEKFRAYKLDEEKTRYEKNCKVVPLRLNEKQMEVLQRCKKILHQPQDSTCIKQLMMIGAIDIHERKISKILSFLFSNDKNNKRKGVPDFD